MNKKHWNTVEIESGIPEAELRRMIDHSYELVVKSLPKLLTLTLAGVSRVSTSFCPVFWLLLW